MKSTTRHDSNNRLPSPSRTTFVSVQLACEAIWSCQDVEAALQWVNLLHVSLTRERLNAYDPSEAFLAIQGLALRFGSNKIVSTKSTSVKRTQAADKDAGVEQSAHNQITRDDNLVQTIHEKCLMAAATLARFCVGPSWWHQLFQRCEMRQTRTANHQTLGRSQVLVEDSSCLLPSAEESSSDTHAGVPIDLIHMDLSDWSNRSCSPMTQPLAAHYSFWNQNASYPPIPEVLPAAMIRFAASSVTDHADSSSQQKQKQSLIQAQIVLVLALCCPPLVENDLDEWLPTDIGWSIPSVAGAMETLVQFWMSGLTPSSDDRGCLALVITRAWTDLLTTGWIPSISLCEQLLDSLLGQVRQAIESALSINLDDSMRGRQDVVALTLLVTESVTAIFAMATKELIPPSRLVVLVNDLCELKVTMLSRMELLAKKLCHVDDLTSDGRQEALAQVDCFNTRRHVCVEDISGLFWVLLAHEESAGPVMDTLFRIMNFANAESPLCKVSKDENTWTEHDTSILKQAAVGIRTVAAAMWGSPPDIIALPSLRIFWHNVLLLVKEILSWTVQRVQLKCVGSMTQDVGDLAIACIAALSSVIDKERRGGVGCLVDSEWETLIMCLENGVLPWLKSLRGNDSALTAAQSVFTLLGNFLQQRAQFDIVPFAEFGVQERLYLFLLRHVLRCLPDRVSSPIGPAVIKCWAKYGLFPYKLEDWSRTVSRILEESFRRSNDNAYLYPPQVRLEAFRVLTLEEDKEENVLLSSSDEIGQDRSIGIPSLLVLTQHLRQHYLELIATSVMPALIGVLCGSCVAHSASCEENHTESGEIEPNKDDLGMDAAATELCQGLLTSSVLCHLNALELYAIRLVGGLYRAASGDANHRTIFISILESVARNRVLLNDDTSPKHGSELYHSFSVRIVAVRELERCLEASFSTLPHSHESVPRTIDALCALLDDYTLKTTHCGSLRERTVLAIAALSPLSRLQIGIDDHVSLHPISYGSDEITEFVSGFLQDQRHSLKKSHATLRRGAPFVLARDQAREDEAKNMQTVLPFHRTVRSISQFLVASAESLFEHEYSVKQGVTCLRVSCYRLIHSLALSNDNFSLPPEIETLVFTVRKPKESADNSAMSLALGHYLQASLFRASRTRGDSPELHEAKTVLSLFLKLFENVSEPDCIEQLYMVPSFLSTLWGLDRRNPSLRFMPDFVSGLELAANNLLPVESPTRLEAFLGLILDLLNIVDKSFLPEPTICSWFRLSYLGLARSKGERARYGTFLAFRCLIALIDVGGASAARKMESFVQSATSTSHDNFDSIILDVLRDRIVMFDGPTRPKEGSSSVNSKHSYLAVEAQNIKSFEAETSQTAENQATPAWLTEKGALLTFRVGSKTSRNAGWLEAVLRTSFSRKRLLYRLPGQPSLDEPDLPLIVAATKRPEESSMSHEKMGCLPGDDGSSEAVDVIDRARAVIRRFDVATQERTSTLEYVKEACNSENTSLGQSDHSIDESNSSPVSWIRLLLEKNGSDPEKHIQEIEVLLESIGSSEKAEISASALLKAEKSVDRAIAVLDRTPVMNTHKIALLYDSPKFSEKSRTEVGARLLGVSKCSPSFHKFIRRIGELLPTRQLKYYSAGLDVSDFKSDGEYTLVWTDDWRKSMSATNLVVFHVSSLMPATSLVRKSHVGNDNVLVMFSDASCVGDALTHFEQDKERSLIGGSFGFVTIFVIASHSRDGSSRVSVRVREAQEASLGNFVGDWKLPEEDAPLFVRNLAMRADLACRCLLESVDAPSNILRRSELLLGMFRLVD